ncbi:MAG: FIST C-terminal domain-containing protein [Porticoccus sp.]|nr:FIST C-terminal domain-containing protein [Porticoccus sp.]MBQ0807555.1 FIST C-terminal domain-containing protein [Porticoccus sp.]
MTKDDLNGPSLSKVESERDGILTAVSNTCDGREAAQEIWQKLGSSDAACVIFFCSPDYDLTLLGSTLVELFQSVPVVGCTTAGEISQKGLTQHSITAFSLPTDQFVVETLLFNNLAAFSAEDAYEVVHRKVERLQKKAIAEVFTHSFVLSLLDGLSICEELVLRALNDALNGIPLVGGSAGDNLNFNDTYVYVDGEFHNNAAVMIFINTVCPFDVIHGHHFMAGSEKLVVTKADPAKRVAIEFNAEPAALEYCRIMGLSLDQLCSTQFALHPLSVQVGEHLYIRSIQQVNDDLSLTFFCAIDSGVVLTKAYDTGMIDHFKGMMFDVVDGLGDPQLIISCDCIHRCIWAEKKDLSKQLSKLYQRYNVIGFSAYGEQHDSLHMNHSFTGVAIGRLEARIND